MCLQLLPYIRRKYGDSVITDQYVNGLYVRERIMAKYCMLNGNDWYDKLHGIASDAKRIGLTHRTCRLDLEDSAPREPRAYFIPN